MMFSLSRLHQANEKLLFKMMLFHHHQHINIIISAGQMRKNGINFRKWGNITVSLHYMMVYYKKVLFNFRHLLLIFLFKKPKKFEKFFGKVYQRKTNLWKVIHPFCTAKNNFLSHHHRWLRFWIQYTILHLH